MRSVLTVLKWSAAAAGLLVGLLAVVGGIGYALLQTRAGQAELGHFIARTMSTPGETSVRIGHISVPAPFDHIRADEISVSDPAGIWAVARNVSIDWHPLALLHRRFVIDALSIDRIEARRPPRGGSSGSAGLPVLPVDLAVDSFSVGRLALAAPVAGTAAVLGVDGHAVMHRGGGGLAGALKIRRLDGPGGSADLAVAWSPAHGRFDIDARVEEPADGLLAHALDVRDSPSLKVVVAGHGPVSDWSGQLKVSLAGAAAFESRIAVTGRDPWKIEAEGSGQLDRLPEGELRGVLAPPLSFSLSADWDGAERLVLHRARFDNAAAHVEAKGAADLLARTGTLDVEASVHRERRYDLSGDGSVTLAGPSQTVTVQRLSGKIAGVALSLRRPAVFRRQPGQYALDGLDVALEGGHVSASGRVDRSGLTAKLAADGLPLALAHAVIPEAPQVDGRADAGLSLDGPLDAPRGSFQVTATGLRLERGAGAELPAAGLSLSGQFGDGRVKTRARLTGLEESDVSLTADLPFALSLQPFRLTVPRQKKMAADLAASKLPLSLVRALVPGAPQMNGRADAKLSLEGSVDGPRGSFQVGATGIRLERGRAADLPAARLSLSGRLDGGRVKAKATLAGLHEADLAMSADLPLAVSLLPFTFAVPQGAEMAADLAASGVPLSLVHALAPDAPELSGRVDGRMALRGPLDSPHGDFRIDGSGLRLEKGLGRDVPAASLSLSGQLGGGRVNAKGRLAGLTRSDVTLAAALPIALSLQPFRLAVPPEGKIGGALDWSGSLEPVAELLPLGDNRIGGDIEVSARLAGTVGQPRMSGQASLTHGNYENLQTGTVLRNLDMSGRFDGSRLVLTKASADDGGSGRVSADGTVELSGAGNSVVDATVKFTRATLVRRDDVTAVMSGDLSLKGPMNDPTLAGKITGDRIEARLIDSLPPEVVTLDVVERDGGGGETSAQGAKAKGKPMRLALDVDVDVPHSVFLRGRGLDSEWGGHLHVGGTVAEPSIRGALRPLRGQFTVAGKNFTLDREGSVSFNGGAEIDPELDLDAKYEARDLVALIHVGGTARRPELSLDSTPPMPKDEIVARILFDKDPGDLTPLEAVQVADTAATLSGEGVGSTGIMDVARRFLGVDVLRFGSGSGTKGKDGSGAEGSVTIGKRIFKDVYVDVSQSAKPGSTDVKVEVDLTPHITVESDVGADAQAGAGIKWKWDY